MDWSKAKTILIIVLLAVCLSLSAVLVYKDVSEKNDTRRSAESAKNYLENQGVSFIADIPLDRPRLPVIFIEVQDAKSSGAAVLTEYKGLKVCWDGGGFVPILERAGKGKAKVCTASSALMIAIYQLINFPVNSTVPAPFEQANGIEIKAIDLVYYADFSAVSAGAKDTAIPSWRIETNRGMVYVNAF